MPTQMPTWTMSRNSFEIALRQFDRVAADLRLDEATRELLRVPMRELQFTLPVRMDDGSAKVLRAFRVQHNDARAPPRAGSASTRCRPWTRSGPWRCG